MTKKSVISKCATCVICANFCVATVTMSLLCMGQTMINYSFRSFRPLFQLLYDNGTTILMLSAFVSLIAINITLDISLQQINEREQHEKKYILENQQNTKSRLELARLKDGG